MGKNMIGIMCSKNHKFCSENQKLERKRQEPRGGELQLSFFGALDIKSAIAIYRVIKSTRTDQLWERPLLCLFYHTLPPPQQAWVTACVLKHCSTLSFLKTHVAQQINRCRKAANRPLELCVVQSHSSELQFLWMLQ